MGQSRVERWPAPDEAATLETGARLGRALAASRVGRDAPLVVYLRGDLGAGKTTLVRGLLRELGAAEHVRSPTYTLVEDYAAGGLALMHADLYRLADASELEFLGLRDRHRSGVVWLVEWPERGAGALPAPDLELHLDFSGTGRLIEARAASEAGGRWLAALD